MNQDFSTSHDPFSPLPSEARIAAEILQHPIALLLGRATVGILDRIADRAHPLLSNDEARILKLCSAAVLFSEQAPRDLEDPRLAHEFAHLLEVMP